ncbi:ribosomal protein L3 N(5)-glutamine methyltransferase [Cephaloticoccus primus]|uniref:Ribosomal protein L3 N(5)-glutamine methyltransferase n=1 Tax=Cephaloticoccus primus TaxID=1548207 RepID=A0A139SSN1_9BACT|nr:ribosomal protein L3 N(5)-glutamine methyltransferase [Cephaloticoccus primus]
MRAKGERRNSEDTAFLRRARSLATPGEWLAFALGEYEAHALALGQIATSAHDEALYLILHTLALPLDSDERVLAQRLDARQRAALADVFRRRVCERTPAAYITREAWLGELRFYVDERVLIPRSYFLELIGPPLDLLMGREPHNVRRVVDVCTGSGCLAILLAQHFPCAQVDAIDLSAPALEVAAKNVSEHELEGRIALHKSDVFDAVPPAKYDLILSNPPYEPSTHCDALPVEFTREPRLALDGGSDGLTIIRKLLRQARERLTPDGLLLIEVGGLQNEIDREFAALNPRWLPTEDGSNCVCLITATALRRATPKPPPCADRIKQ